MPAVRHADLPVAKNREEGLRPREVRDLPNPPSNYWRLVGPGIVAGGVGLSSGEFVLWPFIASQVGLVLLWGALVGVITQFFLNMEVERYTLATGETAVTGFNRFWKHWGLVFAVLVYFANLWPGWAISSATLASYLFGGSPTTIAIASLLVIGFSLTFAPVIYVALERLIFVKVAAVLILAVIGMSVAIEPETWRALPAGILGFGSIPEGLSIALVFGAVAFAGSGGGQNLCQSNWIRDKGFGMGQYVPRLVSPITGQTTAAPTAKSYIFETTPANMARWRSWWRFANVEQVFSFVLVTVITIGFTSMLAHSTLFGEPNLPNNVSFLRIEAERMESMVGRWFGVLFLATGRIFVVRFGDGHHRLHQPPRGRHPEDDLSAEIVHERKPDVLLAGVGHGRSGLQHPSCGDVAADHAPRHLRVDRRRDHVPVLDAADRAEQEDAARGDSNQPVPHVHARVVDAVVRIARRVYDLRSGSTVFTLVVPGSGFTFRVRGGAGTLERVFFNKMTAY